MKLTTHAAALMYVLCESAIIYFYTVEGRSCVDVYRKQDESGVLQNQYNITMWCNNPFIQNWVIIPVLGVMHSFIKIVLCL